MLRRIKEVFLPGLIMIVGVADPAAALHAAPQEAQKATAQAPAQQEAEAVGQEAAEVIGIDFMVPGQDLALSPPAAAAAQMEQARKAHEKNLLRRLNLRIGELQRTCKLSAVQVRRLQLAAKGAVRHELKDFEKQIEQWRRQMTGGFMAVDEVEFQIDEAAETIPGVGGALATAASAFLDAMKSDGEKKGDKGASEPTDREVAALLSEMENMYGPFEMMMSGGGHTQIEQQKVWVKALKSTLSDQQYATHRKRVEARTASQRRASVAGIVSQYDHALLLTDEQRDKMEKLIDSELGKYLEALPASQHVYMVQMLGHLQSMQRVQTRMRRRAGKFLTPLQIEQFNRSEEDVYSEFSVLFSDTTELPGLEEVMEGVEEVVEVGEDAPNRQRGVLGVRLAADTPTIRGFIDESAGKKAGLRVGDVIESIDGEKLRSRGAVTEYLEEHTTPGQEVTVRILRDGQSSDVVVELGSNK